MRIKPEAPSLQTPFCMQVLFLVEWDEKEGNNMKERDLKYPMARKPKRVNEAWLDVVFAPLRDYLQREHPDHVSEMMTWMNYMGTGEEQLLEYRNTRTKGRIVFNRQGEVISCDEDALQFAFDDPPVNRVVRPPREERYVHPHVRQWMEANLTQGQQDIFGELVELFLQEYWGPRVDFKLDDLQTGYPLPGRIVPHCLHVRPGGTTGRLVFQFVDRPIVEGLCRYAEYESFRQGERQLMWQGWQVVSVIRETLDENPHIFSLYLSKAMEMAAKLADTEPQLFD